MIPPAFDYHAPTSLSEAVALLARLGDGAKVLSGGQSLLPLLKLRLGQAEHLVDIGRIPGLEYIREEAGQIRIGGRTRESALEQSELVRAKVPILHDTAKVIAAVQKWEQALDNHPATMIALGAQVVAVGPKGERVIPVENFFLGLFATALVPGEILTEIRIPLPPPRSGGAYMKLERKVGDYATAAAAVQVTLGATNVFDRVRIALTNVGPTPVKCTAAENSLVNKRPSDAAIADAARLAGEACSPSADRRGSVEYKREMSRVLTARALRKAVERAGGQ